MVIIKYTQKGVKIMKSKNMVKNGKNSVMVKIGKYNYTPTVGKSILLFNHLHPIKSYGARPKN